MRAVHTAILGDFLLLADSGTWGDEALPTEGHPVVRSTNIVDNRLTLSVVAYRDIPARHTRSKRLESGDIIVTSSSGSPQHIGKCAILEGEGAGGPLYFSNFTLRLRADQSRLMPKYLYHWLKSAGGRAVLGGQSSTTTGLRNLNKRAYLAQRLPLPPLAEQRRIADLLDRADAVQRKREESRRLVDELLRSVFLEMFGELVTGRVDDRFVPLGDLCDVQLGKMLSQKAKTGTGSIPYLRNANVQWRRFDLESVFEMDFSDGELQRFALSPGDLLVCEGGEVGRCAIWGGQIEVCAFQKALHRIRPKDGRLTMVFLQQWLHYQAARGGLLDSTSQATIAHLTKERIERLRIPVPSTDEQGRFGQMFDQLRSLEDHLAGSSQRVGQLVAAMRMTLFGREAPGASTRS